MGPRQAQERVGLAEGDPVGKEDEGFETETGADEADKDEAVADEVAELEEPSDEERTEGVVPSVMELAVVDTRLAEDGAVEEGDFNS
jgi:hypothetical protein